LGVSLAKPEDEDAAILKRRIGVRVAVLVVV
jgi:hypothetical protein